MFTKEEYLNILVVVPITTWHKKYFQIDKTITLRSTLARPKDAMAILTHENKKE